MATSYATYIRIAAKGLLGEELIPETRQGIEQLRLLAGGLGYHRKCPFHGPLSRPPPDPASRCGRQCVRRDRRGSAARRDQAFDGLPVRATLTGTPTWPTGESTGLATDLRDSLFGGLSRHCYPDRSAVPTGPDC